MNYSAQLISVTKIVMRNLKSSLRLEFIRLIACVLLYSGALKMLNRLVHAFQPKNTSLGGRIAFPFIIRRISRNIQILVYHRVNDERDPFFPAISTADFRKQMQYLAENCNCCPLAEAVERLKKNDVPENTVVITFDDGYKDNYTNAFPVLQRFSIPATIFLATKAIGSAHTLWHDRVFSAFRRTANPMLTGFGNPPRDYPL